MRRILLLALIVITGCGGETFAPTTEDLLGAWHLRARADPPEGSGVLRCEDEFDVEITAEPMTLYTSFAESVTGVRAQSGSNGWRQCTNEEGGVVVNEPYLVDAMLLFVLDGADVRVWRANGVFLYRGRVTSPERMEGEFANTKPAGRGRWWASRQ